MFCSSEINVVEHSFGIDRGTWHRTFFNSHRLLRCLSRLIRAKEIFPTSELRQIEWSSGGSYDLLKAMTLLWHFTHPALVAPVTGPDWKSLTTSSRTWATLWYARHWAGWHTCPPPQSWTLHGTGISIYTYGIYMCICLTYNIIYTQYIYIYITILIYKPWGGWKGSMKS